MKLNLIGRSRKWFTALWAGLLLSGVLSAEESKELNIYYARHYQVDEEINRLFTEKTGIGIKLVRGNPDQLMERLRTEGENSPADLLIMADVARMQRAREQGLLQPVQLEVLDKAVPEYLQDKEGFWHPYSLRARVILVSKDRVKPGEVKNYADLADPKWKGRLLIRSSNSPYNQSLLASIIAAEGEAAARAWAAGVVANMARQPQGGDRDQIKEVARGLADVCVSNSYYYGMLINSLDEKDRELATKVTLVFPNQDDRGVHANVGAAGIARHAKNVENAKAYLEFLVSPEVQKLLANGSYEFPISLQRDLSPVHQSWGEFKVDRETFQKLGENQLKAIEIFDEVGWK